MAQWEKVKFFYDTMLGNTGSTLTATSTESTGDFDVDYIFNMLETNLWKAEDSGLADPQYITLDLGVGNTATADYLIILGHNFNTAGVTVTLQSSTDLAFTSPLDAFTGVVVGADTVFLKEFAQPTAQRYWRLKIAGHGATVPYMTLCIWGEKTELDYASTAFDPYQQENKGTVNMSQGGKVTGIHTRYVERSLNISITDADSTIYNKVKTWFEAGWKQFFVAWETGNNADECWLMRTAPNMNNPLADNGVYRNITFDLKGRKE
jgi:hypothetical protein